MKAHGHPFSVTVDALIGARFPPTLGWYRHNDSHFLRALWTKQHPGGSRDCLARRVIMDRHDEFLLVGENVAGNQARPKAESRLYKIAHTARSNRTELGLVHYVDGKDEFIVL
jgi:hypothetical protein